jgi:hypothetical protein
VQLVRLSLPTRGIYTRPRIPYSAETRTANTCFFIDILNTMFSTQIFLLSAFVASVAAMNAPRSVFSPLSDFHRRGLTGQNIAFACFGGGGDCECPNDLHGDSGVLINVYPGYQCAYPNGACTWDDKVALFQNYIEQVV